MLRTSRGLQLLSIVSSLLAMIVFSGSVAAGEKFHWETDEKAGTSELRWGDQPVVRYMFKYDPSTPETLHDTYKVYHHVFGPGTQQIITKGPGGLYTHHRGMFVAWNKTGYEGKSSDFWHCTQGAHQKHAKFVSQSGDEHQGEMTAEIHWNDAAGKPVIIETRTLRATPIEGGGWQFDWSTSLASQRGEITLDGDRQHSGFQYRADQPVAVSNGARYVRPDSFPQQPGAFEVDDKKDPEGHINLGWLAMTYEIDGKRYSVQYCEDPSLPKPSRYSERPYGRFGAFFKTTLAADKPLRMRYRVLVTPSEPATRTVLQQRFATFTKELAEKP